jgi:outer membrane lipoprotein-sorting protein
MKKLVLLLLLILIIGCNANNEDAFEIIKKVNEKYKDMQSFKAVKITKQQGYIITAIEELYFKGDKYKIAEDDNVEISDGKAIWKYNIDNKAPGKVELHLPGDNAITNAEPKFSFYTLYDEIYSYTLQVDRNKEFSSDNLPELADGNEYYWRVYATDIYGNSNKDDAEIRKFKVDNTKKIEGEDIIPRIDRPITQIQYDEVNPNIYIYFRIDNLNFSEKEIEEMLQALQDPGETIKGDVQKGYKRDSKIKTKKNKIIDYTKKELARLEVSNKDFSYRDYIQWVYNILDLYALNFKIEGEENNHYIIRGTEAKDRVDNFLWSSVEVWVNKEDYTIWKLRLYEEINGEENLNVDYTYEDVSFDELSDELFEYHEEKKEID